MKILITNNHLERLGGSETWVMTMAKELSKKHEVKVYTRIPGYVSELLSEFMTAEKTGYDLALVNHNTCLPVDAKKIVFTSHGIYPPEEVPVSESAHHYVGVSEEICKKYQLDNLIRNPIDTTLFKPTSVPGKVPKRALAIVDDQALRKIKDACAQLGIEVVTPTRYSFETPKLMNEVDLVFSIGRGALEAMSCGRPVILYDERGYTKGSDGYFSDENVRTCNYSGRYFNRHFEVSDLKEEILKYNSTDGKRNRQYILDNHDVKKIAKQYLEHLLPFKL